MKAVKKAFAFYDKIMKKYDPIISKCIHDNIFAIAGQSAFFYCAFICSFVSVLFVDSARLAYIDFVY